MSQRRQRTFEKWVRAEKPVKWTTPYASEQLEEDDGRPIVGEVQKILTQTKTRIERQLIGLLEVNGALTKDLEKQRARANEALEERDELKRLVARAAREATMVDQLRAEITLLTTERDKQDAMLEECGRHLADATQQVVELERLVQRLRNERADAFEEMQSVEEQFQRTLLETAALKKRLAKATAQRDELASLLHRGSSRPHPLR